CCDASLTFPAIDSLRPLGCPVVAAGSGIHPNLYNTIAGTEPAPRRGPACRTACLCVAEARSRHLIGQRSDFLDPDLDDIARLEEFPARRADPGGRAGENDVAWIKRHPARQLRDLLGQIEDHTLAVGILFEDVVHPQLEAEILWVADVARRHDPWAEWAGAVERLVLGPIGLEWRSVADIRAPPAVARGQVVGRGVAGNVIERLFLGHVFGRSADHRGKLDLPIH